MSTATTQPASLVRLTELPRRLETAQGFAEVLAALAAGRPASIDGAWGSSCALLAAALAQHSPGPLVVVLPNQQQIDDFGDDLALFTSAPYERFPAWEAEPGEQLLHDEIYGDRLRTLKRLQCRPSLRDGSPIRSVQGNDSAAT
jgi:transcription-repair coupling factor (superfamily II helicase)